MIHQKLHFDLFNFPSRQAAISSHNNNQKCFYLPCATKKSPEKGSGNNPRRNSKPKQIDLSTQNHSKYESTKPDELKTSNTKNIYFNEKNILHNIKYKKSLENSKTDNDDPLNFTYFSKEIGIFHDKKPINYHILKDFLSPFKKKVPFLKNAIKKKIENSAGSKIETNFQNSNNISKKLPDISKESDNLDILVSKELPIHRNKLTIAHKKNKALDYKQYNVLMEKTNTESTKTSNNSRQKTQNSEHLGDSITKSKMAPLNSKEENIHRIAFLLEKGPRTQNSEHLGENINKSKMSKEENTNRKTSIVEKNKPMSPKSALRDFSDLFTNFEKSEILNYKEIYYITSGLKNANQGGSFEDKKGYYSASPGDHVNYRYEIIEELGKGTFGKVFKVFDHKKQQECALKIMKKEKIYYTQAMNEIKILTFVKEKDTANTSNIVKMINYFMFRNHMCIVFELLSISLYSFLKSNHFYGLNFDLIRKMAIQLFQTLTFLYKNKVIHCDLKPENILLKNINKSGIKVIDLGSSCFIDTRCYSYLQSRYYRSPEVIFGLEYGTEIDTWSMGCVLAELFIGSPLFPGESEPDMVSMLCEVLGLPDIDLIKKTKKKDKFFDFQSDGGFSLKTNLVLDRRTPGTKPLKEIFNNENADFIDLVEKCLTFDPKKRIKPYDALTHPWIINDLPKEIKPLYIKDCQELKKEIEEMETPRNKVILIDEGVVRGKSSYSSKDNSFEKRGENLKSALNETKLKVNQLIKNENKTNDDKNSEYEMFERKYSKENEPKTVGDVRFRPTRKIHCGKKKSITFHQLGPEHDYFS